MSFTSSDGHYTRGDGKIYIFKGTGYCWVESNEAPGAVEKAVEKAVETAVEKEAGVVDKA